MKIINIGRFFYEKKKLKYRIGFSIDKVKGLIFFFFSYKIQKFSQVKPIFLK